MTPEPINFIIGVKLRADVMETLRKAGCPYLAQEIMEETIPAHNIPTQSDQDKQEKFVTDAITFACEKHDNEIQDKMLDKFKEIIRLHDEDELLYPDLYNEFLVIYKSLRSQSTTEAPDD